RDGTLPLRKCTALAYRRTRSSLRAIQSLRRNAARDRAARDRRSKKGASRQQQPGALSFTRNRARSQVVAAILPWGQPQKLFPDRPQLDRGRTPQLFSWLRFLWA